MRYSRALAALPTAVFIDYDDLYHVLLNKLGRAGAPEKIISEATEALLTLLQRQMNAQITTLRAYADFPALDVPGIPQALADGGVQAAYVSESRQRNAAEIELTMDAVALLATRPDVRRVVVMTGQRLHLPLLRRIKEMGRSLVVVSSETLRERASLLLDDQDRVLSLMELAPDALRRDAEAPPVQRENVEYTLVEDEGALKALEIIEEFFGQYNEVYLTPLLRKLSDELDDDTIDPKTVISDLEEAGAVYLEKRRGYPHDYTVLLVDALHPDVDRVRQMFEDYDDEDEDDDEMEVPYDDALAPVPSENGFIHAAYEDEDMEEAA